MAFVLTLLLGLSAMVRVESAAAAGQKDMLAARQNALLGLQVALGNLQRQMGPDQRVSAPASLFKDAADPTQPVPGLNDKRRHWTGVWDAAGKVLDPDVGDYPLTWVRSPNAEHLGWLVSGIDEPWAQTGDSPSLREDLGFDLSWNASAGQPNDPRLALLVGEGSVGELSGTGQEADFVFAPKVEVPAAAAASKLPGTYAYWIGDEARKAPINLVDARYLPGGAVPAAASRRALTAPEKVGVEALPGWADYNLNNPDLAQSLDKSAFYMDAALADPDTGATEWEARLPSEFHDLGLGGRMLQVDVRNGGLKKDLNLLFELEDAAFNASPYGGQPATDEESEEYADNPPYDPATIYSDPYTGGPVSYLFKYPVPSISADAFIRGPTWHFLRSYYNLYRDVDVGGNFEIAARPYRPNTKDFTEIYDRGGRFATYAHIMNSPYNGDVRARDNSVNTRLTPISSHFLNSSGTFPIGRLTAHEVAPIAVRFFLFFGFTHVDLDDVIRIERDADGNVVPRGDNQYEFESTGPGTIAALTLQPVVVLWNPYNVPLSFNAYKLSFGGQSGLALDVSWTEENANPENRGYLAALADLFHTSIPNTGSYKNNTLEFLVGNPPDGSSPIVLQPGEQKVFSANTLHQLGDVMVGDEALFLEPGWNVGSGGLLLYRTADTVSARQYAGQFQEIDNIPADATDLRVNEVYWSRGNPSKTGGRIKQLEWSDFLLDETSENVSTTDPVSGLIADGGNSASNDWLLRTLGGSHSVPPGGDIHAVFDDVPQSISQNDITASGIYPFMGMEVVLNPANTSLGVPVEMLGATNPFAVLGSSIHGGNAIPDRFQIYIHAMAGAPSYDTFNKPQEVLGEPDNTYYGYNYSISEGSARTVLQEVPTVPLWSLGSLQHANIGRSGFFPRNAIGNAQATPFVGRGDLDLTEEWTDGTLNPTLYDLSYLSNDALFDGHFFSSLAPETAGNSMDDVLAELIDDAASTGQTPSLPNRRFAYIGGNDYDALEAALGADDGYRKTAAYWAPEGGFNVNSTSIDAWRAFLAANLNRSFNYHDGVSMKTDAPTGVVQSRYALPNAEADADDWNAPLTLTAAELDELASSIVAEVRARGPFLSLADFINRRPGSLVSEHQRQGALARAIEASTINDDVRAAGIDAYQSNLIHDSFRANNTLENTAAGIPGWLTQADVLTPLAPYLSARSDTFVIRVAGEAPRGAADSPVQVWCEALVQRIPDYVEPAPGGNVPWDRLEALTGVNARMGRRFRVIRFRWLDKEDV